MYHIMIREINDTINRIAWTESEFLFREYVKKIRERYPYDTIHLEFCNTEGELQWIFKKYNVRDSILSDSKIMLVYDTAKTTYGLTTCKMMRVGLGGRNLFSNTEDDVRMKYVNKMFWLVTWLRRFSTFDESIPKAIHAIVTDRFLDRHSIDMYRYFIECEEYPNFFKL